MNVELKELWIQHGTREARAVVGKEFKDNNKVVAMRVEGAYGHVITEDTKGNKHLNIGQLLSARGIFVDNPPPMPQTPPAPKEIVKQQTPPKKKDSPKKKTTKKKESNVKSFPKKGKEDA